MICITVGGDYRESDSFQRVVNSTKTNNNKTKTASLRNPFQCTSDDFDLFEAHLNNDFQTPHFPHYKNKNDTDLIIPYPEVYYIIHDGRE